MLGVQRAKCPAHSLRDAPDRRPRAGSRDCAGFREADYRFDLVTFHSIGFPWGGLGFVRGKGALVQGPSFSRATVQHELGHNLGNWHAGGWLAGGESVIGPGQRLEYGNEFDIMGSGLGHLNANFKFIAGWLTEANILTVLNDGTYRIHAMDTGAELNGANSYALRIPAGSPLHGLPSDYWLDIRQQFTNNPLAMSGALVHWATNTSGPDHSQLLGMNPGGVLGFRDAPLAVGRTFADTSRGIFITPVAKGGGDTDVWMDIAAKLHPTNSTSPTISLNASQLAVNPGEIIQFTTASSDADGDTLTYFWDFGDGSLPESSLNQIAVNKSWTTSGEYVVRCTVSDTKGGEASASVLVRVGNPTTYHISGRVLWQGNPLQGVRINNGLTGPDYRSDRTDSEGRFVLVGLSATSYVLGASKPGFNFAGAFTNPVSIGSQHIEGLVFFAETNTAMFLTGFVPPSGTVGSTVAIRGINLFYPVFLNGVSFGGVPAVNYSYNSPNLITAMVPHGAISGPVIVKTWSPGLSATSVVSFVVLPTAPGILEQPRSQTNGFGFGATFRVTASGSGPFASQWRKNGEEIPAGTNRVLTLTNLQSESAGAYDLIVANTVGSVTSAVARLEIVQMPTFEEALESTGLVWTTGGDEGWRTQTNSTFDGIDAAESGYLPDAAEESWLETTVIGPGMLRFRYLYTAGVYLSLSYWTAPGQPTNRVNLDSIYVGSWVPAEFRFPAGTYTLRWVARTCCSDNLRKARLDEVSFTSGLPPLITQHPESQYVIAGQSVTFAVQAEGSEPLLYQWFREYWGPIPDATNRSYTIANVSREDHASYYVEIWNAAGSLRSLNASLWVPDPPSVTIGWPRDGDEVPSGNVGGYLLIGNFSPFGIARIELFDGLTKLADALNPGSYYPWSLTNVAPGRRLSLYAIATDGAGQIGTSATVSASVVLKLVPQGTLWKYFNGEISPGLRWQEVNFNDSAWPIGGGAFGYPAGTPDLVTGLDYGPDPTNNFITTWFRRAFTVADAASISNVVLWLRRDDGAVIYLNGTEIFRSNLPDGPIEPITLASASVEGTEETAFFPQRVPGHLFVSGTNVLAVEVHQADSGPMHRSISSMQR